MSSAYAYAEGGPIPEEIILLKSIDRFGAQMVYGRPLSFHEIRMLTLANNVVLAYQSREKSDNWALWAKENPDKAELLAQAGKIKEAK